MTKLAIFVDRPARVVVNGLFVGVTHPAEPLFLDVIPGEHLVIIVPDDINFAQWRSVVRVPAGQQEVVDVKFQRADPRIGVPGQVVDPRDGQVYRSVYLAGRHWLAENVRYAVPGSEVPENAPSKVFEFGRLYSRSEADAALAPDWRLPTMEDWSALLAIGQPEPLKHLLVGGQSGFNACLAGNHHHSLPPTQRGQPLPEPGYSPVGISGWYWSSDNKVGFCEGLVIRVEGNARQRGIGLGKLANGVTDGFGTRYMRASVRAIINIR